MSPRSERRPDQWAGAGGRRSSRPGSGGAGGERRPFSRGGVDRGAVSRGRPERPFGARSAGERPERPATSRDRSDRPDRPTFSRDRGDRPSFSRSQADRPGASRRSAPPERRGRRVLPERRAGAMSRSALQVAAPEQPPQGVHTDDDQPSDLLWGRHVALAALESGRPLHRIWCTPEMRFTARFLQLLREAKASGVLVEEVTWARLGQITGGAVHQGIVLQVAAAETLDLAALIEGCSGIGESPLLVALDGITDPHNLGAIARSAEAMGAHGLVLPQRRSAGLTGSVAKVAAGALEHLPVARVVNLNRALDTLKQEGYRVIGLAAEGSVSLEQADLDGPLVLVTGSEADGLAMLTRRHCDQLVSIPLRGATPSLNASVASALLLYEVARRSWMRGLRGGDPPPRLVRPQLPTAAPAPPDPDPALPLSAEVPLPQVLSAEQTTLASPSDPAATEEPSHGLIEPSALQADPVPYSQPEDHHPGDLAAAELEPAGEPPAPPELPDEVLPAPQPQAEQVPAEPSDDSSDSPDPGASQAPEAAPVIDLDGIGGAGFHADVQL
ncbi:MAG: 23S rRNA (guanosine(2251)-2'-O)-methyltransferase RlmB [Chitinophagaceae bacterium]|nr:23S rRNA (guanosine(2251)-2'-O)-methyltransferase RlmB [Chitinophagaceae bacterium]